GGECHGVRTPSTASSQYQLLGTFLYQLSPRTSVFLTGAASQEQFRTFDYDLLFIPKDQAAARGWSRMVTLGLHHELAAAGHPLSLDLALSVQGDRAISGGLTSENEASTRDGMLTSALQFAFDFDNFPLDDELVTNIRNNTPGSRRTPLDLSNASQYDYVDQYRNSPYGLDGGPEQGGPAGRMTLFRENRTVAVGNIGWRPDSRQLLEAGFEFSRFTTAGYNSFLTTEAFIDAFIESPTRSGFYAQDHVTLDRFVFTAGVRYERFHSNAARPFVLDTISGSPRFGTYSYFPTPSSYGSGGITFGGDPLLKFVQDESRSALNPSVQVEFEPFPRSAIRVGVARQSQMPPLAAVFSGINTDLRVTNTNQLFGGDLDLEKTTTYEIGFRHEFTHRLSFDGAYYYKDLQSQGEFRLVSLADPSRLGESVDIRQATSLGLATIKGIETRLDLRTGPLEATVGYSYQKAESGTGTQLAGSHPHGLTGIVALNVPDTWRRGSLLGSVLQNLGVYAGFRYTSGAAYTACPPESGNESVLAGETCAGAFQGDFMGARLPSVKQLDLRLTRGFAIGGHQVMAFLDARNLLNVRNVLNVFAVNGQTTNPSERASVLSADSNSFAIEANQNGARLANGDIDLSFNIAACEGWVDVTATPAAPNCVYLIRTEERFGDGDHIFTVSEQRRASAAHYDALRAENNFLGAPRRLRLGVEVRF
ncbi:MAG: TonB-dependent receptor, partial [Gemmatimonadota bacterium]